MSKHFVRMFGKEWGPWISVVILGSGLGAPSPPGMFRLPRPADESEIWKYWISPACGFEHQSSHTAFRGREVFLKELTHITLNVFGTDTGVQNVPQPASISLQCVMHVWKCRGKHQAFILFLPPATLLQQWIPWKPDFTKGRASLQVLTHIQNLWWRYADKNLSAGRIIQDKFVIFDS